VEATPLRGTPPSSSIARVTATKRDRIEVRVELEAGGEPIRGAVRADGRIRPFHGWMQLTAALEDARAAASDGRASPAQLDAHETTDRE
jgi:hypothetical protein